jgi:chromosome segregation ATPase
MATIGEDRLMAIIKELQEEWEDAEADVASALNRIGNLTDQLRQAQAQLNDAMKKETEARFALRAKKEKV